MLPRAIQAVNRLVAPVVKRSSSPPNGLPDIGKKYCGYGYGSDALNTLCKYIHKTYGITNFIISPSARNKRAIAAYKKAGFEYVKIINKEEQEKEFGKSEYDDNIMMIKTL